ncbi:MAG TPA: cupredoxin domain-containing protein [Thermoleophilaceae bacterium]|jgi:plastocyanin
MRKLLTVIAVVSLLAALAVTGVGAASGSRLHAAGKTRTVEVSDDFFSPKKITIKRKTTVKWVWKNAATGGPQTDNNHSVVDEKGRFSSEEMDTGTFRHKFKKAGTWNIVCSVHPDDMTMKVRVKKS